MSNKINTLPTIERLLASVFLSKQCQHTPIYLAVSGGRDSLALAFACVQLKNHQIINALPTIIHINHNLQAPSADWANLVATFAKTNGFDCQIIKLNLTKSDENTARQARYDAFFSVLPSNAVLMLAHHADDQAETLLMRLVNGAGLDGLSAMREWSIKKKDNKIIQLCRPLLSVTRQQISDYATANRLPYIDDPTNDTGDNVRAIIRRQIMPLLQHLNPKANVNMARTALLLQGASEQLQGQMNNDYARCVDDNTQSPYYFTLKINELLKLATTNQSAVVRAFIQGGATYPPSLAMVERVLALCHRTDNDHKTELIWQGDKDNERWVLVRYRERLYRYRLDVWGFLKGENDEFDWQVPNDFVKLNLTKKQRQRLAIASWLAGHLWGGCFCGAECVLFWGGVAFTDKRLKIDDELPSVLLVEKKAKMR